MKKNLMENKDIQILVVDDQPSNLRFLSNLLTDRGYQVKRARSGSLALSAALTSPPNLILLDVMLPDLSGYEVCQKLQENESTQSIPIIFLSVLDEVSSKLKAFNMGGVDYITKPFQSEEVLMRIGKQITLQKLQKKLEEQNKKLQQSESLLASILNSSLDGIGAFSAQRNTQGNIIDFQAISINEAARKILRLPPQSSINRSLLEEMPEHRRNGLFDLYISVVETGEALELEFYYECEHSPSFWLQIAAVKLQDGFAATWRDITERKQAETALRKSEEQLQASLEIQTRYLQDLAHSNAELEQFAYVASHDLQAPLGTVASYAQLLERRYADQLDDRAKKFIDNIVNGCTRMQALIDDLLQYSRLSRKQNPIELISCQQIFEEACANLQLAIRRNQATVTCDPLPTVMADASQLVQLFQNLIGNAIKYRREEQPSIHISSLWQEDNWLFSVQDNGIGIEARHYSRIFQIFQRLHAQNEYSGTGIGLAICQKIVERHGGRIWVESELGRGSIFYFTLPVSDSSEKAVNLRSGG